MGESEQKRNDRNLDALILAASDVLIDEDVEYLNSIDVSKTVISPKLDRRIRRRIHRESRKESIAKLMSYTRRVAAVFLVICSISFVLCMSVEAIRTRIWGTILTWFDDHVEIDFVDSANSTAGITAYREPSYYPDGVTAEPDGKTAEKYVVAYMRNDKLAAMYVQTPLKGDFEKAHKDYEVEAVLINQTSGQIRQHKKGNDLVLLWHDGVYAYKIIGYADDFDKDTLIKMAESVATVEYTERPNVITDYKEPELRIKGTTKTIAVKHEHDYMLLYYVPEIPDDFVMASLICKDSGEMIKCDGTISFFDNEQKGSYENYLFSNVSADMLENYELYGEFTTSSGSVEGYWSVTFPLENIQAK